MDDNPYTSPSVAAVSAFPLDTPVLMTGLLTPEQAREVEDRFSKRNNHPLVNTLLVPLLLVLMSTALLYVDYRSVPKNVTFWEGFAFVFYLRWYVIVGLPVYFLIAIWLKFSSPSPAIEQEFTFAHSSLAIKNEHVTAELGYDAIKTIQHDSEFIKIELAHPHSGSFVIHRDWCQNAGDWEMVVAHLQINAPPIAG